MIIIVKAEHNSKKILLSSLKKKMLNIYSKISKYFRYGILISTD